MLNEWAMKLPTSALELKFDHQQKRSKAINQNKQSDYIIKPVIKFSSLDFLLCLNYQ